MLAASQTENAQSAAENRRSAHDMVENNVRATAKGAGIPFETRAPTLLGGVGSATTRIEFKLPVISESSRPGDVCVSLSTSGVAAG